MPTELLALAAGLGFALVVLGQRLGRVQSNRVGERLARIKSAVRTLDQIELQQPFAERVLRPFVRQIATTLSRLQNRAARAGQAQPSEPGLDAIRRRLALAGNPFQWTAADYLGTKALAALALATVLFFLLSLGGEPGYAFLFAGLGAAFGWFGPDLLLRSRTTTRRREIQRALPDALDLLVISVEAGLGFDAAMQRLVEKRSDALAIEFARVLAEMRVGRSRRDALKEMVARTEVPDLSQFVSALLQADQLGVSVTRVLTVQAEQMRVLRRQRAEEQAAKLQLKMIFPLAIFVFPALCVVILGPIWPTLATSNAPAI